jgi:TolA-binding protein
MFGILAGFGLKKLMGPLIVIVTIGGLIYAGKSYIENKDLEITNLKSQVATQLVVSNQLRNNISVLNGTIVDLNVEINEQKFQKQLVTNQVQNLEKANSAVQKIVVKQKIKLSGRDILSLRESKHRELVLKIINKSVKKQFKVFDNDEK